MCTFLQLHFCTLLERCTNEEMLKLSYCWTTSGLLEVSSQPAPLSGETDRKNQWGWVAVPAIFLGVSKVQVSKV